MRCSSSSKSHSLGFRRLRSELLRNKQNDFCASFNRLREIENIRGIGIRAPLLPTCPEDGNQPLDSIVEVTDVDLLRQMATIPELQRKLPARRQMRHDGLEVDNDKENMKVAFSSATTSAVPAQARPLEEPTPPTLGLCECCYDELPFEQDNFVQCSRGHLFGMSCLKNHANAQAFGKLSSQLPCMASNENCTAEFPPNAIQQLPAKTQSTLTVLEARESVLAAKLQNIE